MIDRIRKARDEESGFTLIELLVVVIIIGILAAIAIPVFLNQRESAWRSAVESDVRNAAMDVETYYTETREYPSGFGTSAGQVEVQESDNVTLSYIDNGQTFCVQGDHAELGTGVMYYDSGAGGLIQPGDWSSCGNN